MEVDTMCSGEIQRTRKAFVGADHDHACSDTQGRSEAGDLLVSSSGAHTNYTVYDSERRILTAAHAFMFNVTGGALALRSARVLAPSLNAGDSVRAVEGWSRSEVA